MKLLSANPRHSDTVSANGKMMRLWTPLIIASMGAGLLLAASFGLVMAKNGRPIEPWSAWAIAGVQWVAAGFVAWVNANMVDNAELREDGMWLSRGGSEVVVAYASIRWIAIGKNQKRKTIEVGFDGSALGLASPVRIQTQVVAVRGPFKPAPFATALIARAPSARVE